MQTCGGVETYLHAFLTSALDGGEWFASRPLCFTAEERTPVHIGYEAGLVPELVWTLRQRE
jgi:hypothetical protein